MIKYFIYARKSSEGKDRQITSKEDQIEECLKIAKRQNLHVVDIIEESKSAKEPGRKGFNEMMKRIEKGEANGVITLKLNRISRNPIDGANFIWKLQKGVIKHVQTISQGFYSKDNLVIMYFELGMSTQYSNDLGNRISIGTAKKSARGWYPIAKLPCGYLHNDKKSISFGAPEIIKDEIQFPILQSLWKKILEDCSSIQEIKALGDAEGLKSIKNQLLSESAYYRLFRNEFYCGTFTWKNEEGELTKFKGKHIPMVTLKEFNDVQRILNHTASPVVNIGDADKEYANIFNCGECGCMFTTNIVNRAYCLSCRNQFSINNKSNCPKCDTSIMDKTKFTFLYKVYYRCTKKKGTCKQKYLTKGELEKQVLEYLKTLTLDEQIYKWALEQLEKQGSLNSNQKIEEELERKIKNLEKKIRGYTELRVDKELSKAEYIEYSTPLRKNVETLRVELENIKCSTINWQEEMEQALDFTKNLLYSFKNGDSKVKRKILLKLGTNNTIINGKAEFITPKALSEAQKLVEPIQAQNEWNEHKKSLVKQGDLWKIDVPFSVGDADAKKDEQL